LSEYCFQRLHLHRLAWTEDRIGWRALSKFDTIKTVHVTGNSSHPYKNIQTRKTPVNRRRSHKPHFTRHENLVPTRKQQVIRSKTSASASASTFSPTFQGNSNPLPLRGWCSCASPSRIQAPDNKTCSSSPSLSLCLCWYDVYGFTVHGFWFRSGIEEEPKTV
jgi:hypothetical protein